MEISREKLFIFKTHKMLVGLHATSSSFCGCNIYVERFMEIKEVLSV